MHGSKGYNSKLSILFVGNANACRSAMAEALCRRMLSEMGVTDVEAHSAGLDTTGGHPASEGAIAAMERGGLDLSEFRTAKLTGDKVGAADLILTMTRVEKLLILRGYPEKEGRVFTLKDYGGGFLNSDIEDPGDRGLEGHLQCAREINAATRRALDKILVKACQ